MAKIAPVTQSPAVEKLTPTVYVDLSKSDVGELKGVSIGDKVRVIVTGKVLSISQRADDGGKTGSISIESKDVQVKDAPNGEFEKLAEDDD